MPNQEALAQSAVDEAADGSAGAASFLPDAPLEDGTPEALEVPISFVERFSPHVIDLKPPAAPPVRPSPDFSQKFASFGHAVRTAVGRPEAFENRTLVPRRPANRASGASLSGFLKLLPTALAGMAKREAKPRTIPSSPVASQPVPVTKPAPKEAPAAPKPAVLAPIARPEPKITVMPVVKAGMPLVLPEDEADVAPPRARRNFVWSPDPRWRKRLGAFFAASLAVSLPIQGLMTYGGVMSDARAVIAGTSTAVGELKAAGENALRFEGSGDAFARAASSFADARERVDGLAVSLAAVAAGQGERFSAGKNLLAAGERFSRAGAEIGPAFEAFEQSSSTPTPERVRGLLAALAAATPHLEDAVERLGRVSERSLPEEYRATFAEVRGGIGALVGDVRRATGAGDALLRMIGAEGKRRYLVVFQNSRELRPTGGFIGSYALMDIKDGLIENVEIPAGGSYDLRGGLNQRIAAPEQLRLVNARWEFQDANWFADFPTSARSLTWFYEKSGGPTVDGVVAVTSDVMERLLAVVGPIEMPEYGKTLSSENFHDETQKSVELEYDRVANRPKQIISDMAPKLLQRIVASGSERLLPLGDALAASLASKDIQVYFRDEAEQAFASSYGWSGELRPLPNADFLAVVDSNVAGGKTDAAIEADVRLETEVAEDGTMTNTLTVRRTHRGDKNDPFEGIKNITYLRAYVPGGSTLLEAEGFGAPGDGYFLRTDETLKSSTLLAAVEGSVESHEASGTRISHENGLTTFGNWIQLEPGETRSVRLRYRLPFKLQELVRQPESGWERLGDKLGARMPTANLKLVVRKQAGAKDRRFRASILLPEGWKPIAVVPDDADGASRSIVYDAPLDRDLYLGAVVAAP